MIIFIMQYPGQGMNSNSVLAILHREPEPQSLISDDEDPFGEVIGSEHRAEKWEYATCPKCGSRKYEVVISDSGPISDSSGALGSWWKGTGKCHDCLYAAPYADQSL